MKVEWERKDIVSGRRYTKDGIGEEWIIGYMPWEEGAANFVSTSLSDGMVFGPPKTKEQLAKDLTEAGYLPVELINSSQN